MTYEEARELIQEHLDYGGSLDSHGLAAALSGLSASIADTAGAKPAFEPTREMLIAARDWSAKKYGKPIGDDAAIGCWKAMFAATPAPSVADAAGARTTLNYDGTVDITCAHCGGNGCFACLRKESGNE